MFLKAKTVVKNHRGHSSESWNPVKLLKFLDSGFRRSDKEVRNYGLSSV